jgi:Skp family chaperone for outer membrane proteins
MSLTLLAVVCLFTPILIEPPKESIAIVDLRECFKHAPTAEADRATLSKSIHDTDAEAKKLVDALKESEYYAALGNATEQQKIEARVQKLEFDAYRRREQDRLMNAERDMFKKWHKHVDIAVKTVAQRDGFTVILYIGQDKDDAGGAVTEPQSMLTRSHLGFVLDQHRSNITEKIVAEMSTAAFVDAIATEKKSEQ